MADTMQTALALEAFLARLYSDEAACAAFIADATGEATRAGLAPADVARLAAVDRAALVLAARSYARKRARAGACPRHGGTSRAG
jgi:hypothetical protein